MTSGSLFQFLRRLCARWIATPWWNLRFSLGYRIGGFTRVERNYPKQKEME